MYFLDLTLPTAEENLALDEALLQAAEGDGQAEYLRLWESPRNVVVLGKNCRVDEDVWVDRCRADDVPVIRRCSGGGTVLLGPGCLNYSAVLRYDRATGLDSVTASFAYCLDRVQSALATGGVSVRIAGSDLIWQDRKFGGSAQRRQRTHFLHHGTILYRFDIPSISRYLKEPRRQPTHRAGREHSRFLTSLPATGSLLGNQLRSAWDALDPHQSPPLDLAAELVADRYGRREWNYQR